MGDTHESCILKGPNTTCRHLHGRVIFLQQLFTAFVMLRSGLMNPITFYPSFACNFTSFLNYLSFLSFLSLGKFSLYLQEEMLKLGVNTYITQMCI